LPDIVTGSGPVADPGPRTGPGTAAAPGIGPGTAAARLPARPADPLPGTRHVRLRPITDADSTFLYALMSDPEAGGRVRFAGATPSPDQIVASLWEGVLAQFVVEGVTARQPLGLVAVTSPNFRDGWAYLSAVGVPYAQGSGLMAEGVILGFDYAFRTWPFRKIYMEVGETNYGAFRSGLGRFFAEEGRLREHAFWDGRYTDLFVLSVLRSTWAEQAPEVLARLRDTARPPVRPVTEGGA
jgi:RimJ/RimL family protein N-acetyltransferase